MDFTEVKNIGFSLGIKFDIMLVCRAELIHLRNDGLRVSDIAILLDVNREAVYKWFNNSSLPKEKIIDKLDNMYLQRIGYYINKIII